MIGPDERLGRRVSGKSQRKKVRSVLNRKRPTLPLTLIKPDEKGDLSLDRLKDEKALRFLSSLARDAGGSFRGWAVLSVGKLQAHGFEVEESKTDENPYHAHIPMPEWTTYGNDQVRRAALVRRLTRCLTDWQDPIPASS